MSEPKLSALANEIFPTLARQIELLQTVRPGRADVHAGTLAHRLESLEDLDVARVVRRHGVCHAVPAPSVGPLGPSPVVRPSDLAGVVADRTDVEPRDRGGVVRQIARRRSERRERLHDTSQ